eukprot:TRINITY_DN2684_c0_g1_i1.p1 TRINITY_DN2684_c0_g1~~TRINITY_DN2684_c0_g1_i1.p1  ORF type:complete len:127 (-),score=6.21 TRINITY_DN2684_c0_g1_i1:64-444(-)
MMSLHLRDVRRTESWLLLCRSRQSTKMRVRTSTGRSSNEIVVVPLQPFAACVLLSEEADAVFVFFVFSTFSSSNLSSSADRDLFIKRRMRRKKKRWGTRTDWTDFASFWKCAIIRNDSIWSLAHSL